MTDETPPRSLETLVAAYLERVDAGEASAIALNAICAEVPEQAQALRRGAALVDAFRLQAGPNTPRDSPQQAGPYRLLRRLGEGGMGIVYLATRETPRRRAALKLIRPDQLLFEDVRARFEREIESIACLNHANIAAVYETGEEGGTPWFAQEYVVGAPLDHLLASVSPHRLESLGAADLRRALALCCDDDDAIVPADWSDSAFEGNWVEACLRITLQMAQALEHAHSRGVLHRDVKPSNVLLSPSGRAVLVDFGLASLQGTERLTRTGTHLGSLHYMPPEQLEGRVDEIDARSDVYALGVTLYELLTLRAPYSSRSLERLRGLILSGGAPSARAINSAVGKDAACVVARAMDLDPKRRYQSAKELADDLKALLEHRPVTARPLGLGIRAGRWVSRKPALAVAAVASVLLFVVGPIAFGLQRAAAAKELGDSLLKTESHYRIAMDAVERVLRLTANKELLEMPGMQETSLRIADEALEIFDSLAEERPDDSELLVQRARLLHTRANALAVLGLPQKAFQAYETATDLLEDYLGENDADASLAYLLVSIYCQQGDESSRAGQAERAIDLYTSALLWSDRAREGDPSEPEYVRMASSAAGRIASELYQRNGWNDEVQRMQELSLDAARKTIEMMPGFADAHHALFVALETQAGWLYAEGDVQAASLPSRAAVASIARAVQLSPSTLSNRSAAVSAKSSLAHILTQIPGTRSEALELAEQACGAIEELILEYPDVPSLRESERLAALGSKASALRALKRQEEAFGVALEIALARESIASANPDSPVDAANAAIAYSNLASFALSLDSLGEARLELVFEHCAKGRQLLDSLDHTQEHKRLIGRPLSALLYCEGSAHFYRSDPEQLRASLDARYRLEYETALTTFGTAELWGKLYTLTRDQQDRREGIAALEYAVELGFSSLVSLDHTEIIDELGGGPELAALRERVRAREIED